MLNLGFGSKPQNGKEKIDGALGLFTSALTQLNEGIDDSKQEIEGTQEKLEAKKKAWEEEQAKLNGNIAANKEDISKAEKVKRNIEKLLG